MSVCMEVTSGVHSFQDENNSGYISCIHCGEKQMNDSLLNAITGLQDGTITIGESLLKLVNTLIDRHLELQRQVNDLQKEVALLAELHEEK
jgi:hypothetical protein